MQETWRASGGVPVLDQLELHAGRIADHRHAGAGAPHGCAAQQLHAAGPDKLLHIMVEIGDLDRDMIEPFEAHGCLTAERSRPRLSRSCGSSSDFIFTIGAMSENRPLSS